MKDNTNGGDKLRVNTMLNAEMAQISPTPDIPLNTTDTTEGVMKVATSDNNPINLNPNQLSDGFTEYFSNTFGGFTLSALTNKCEQWQSMHHVYFQLANALFLIAFLAPHKTYGFLLTRCALVIGSILMILWSYLVKCSADALIWSCLFLAVNFPYLLVLIYRMRPVRFEKEIDAVNIKILCNSFID